MSGIIDFHTHAFPDHLAPAAIPALEEKGEVKAVLDGTLAALLASMDQAEVEQSVLCSIATKPSQYEAILDWSREIRSERILPFPSVHPADPLALERLAIIKAEGFKGIKLHPYYQEFFLDEERLFPIYEKLCAENLLLVMHTGFDIGFPRIRCADPGRVLAVINRFPDLKLVATHLGAWDLWQEVEEQLIGRPLYMDISFALQFLAPEAARRLILRHPPEYILFGSDSPWAGQQGTSELLRGLNLGRKRETLIFRTNGLRLLESAG